MKKTFLLYILTFITITFSFAQNVAINADATLPNSSAMLDVKSANKGLLIPRVALTGTADATTIPSPATSLMVYNTTAAGTGTTAVVAGYYYWNGTAWVRLVGSTTPTNSTFKTLIPFASGGTITVGTAPFSFSRSIGLVGFGNSVTTTAFVSGGPLSLSNGPNLAFVVPSSGIITDISGFFSSNSTHNGSSNITINCLVYISDAFNSNNFNPVAGGAVTISPNYLSVTPPGTTATGTLSGLNIPVTAGSRIMMVVSAADNPFFTSSISGYFSGGINMVIQ